MTEVKFYDSVAGARNALDAERPELAFNRAIQNVDFSDAQQALAFLVPQMLQVETATYMVKVAKANWAEYMPLASIASVWSPGSLFEVGDIAGKAEWFDVAASDMPYVGTSSEQFIQENHIRGIGFRYDRMEMERARMLGKDVVTERAASAVMIAERDRHNIAMKGSTTKFATGFVNDPFATIVSAGAVFTSMTPEALCKLINDNINQIAIDTKQNYEATTVTLPLSLRSKLAEPMTEGSKSIMTWLRENVIVPVQWNFSIDMNTAGTGGKPRIAVYCNTSECHRFHSTGYEFGDVRQVGDYVWARPGLWATGGYENRLPLTKRFVDSN